MANERESSVKIALVEFTDRDLLLELIRRLGCTRVIKCPKGYEYIADQREIQLGGGLEKMTSATFTLTKQGAIQDFEMR